MISLQLGHIIDQIVEETFNSVNFEADVVLEELFLLLQTILSCVHDFVDETVELIFVKLHTVPQIFNSRIKQHLHVIEDHKGLFLFNRAFKSIEIVHIYFCTLNRTKCLVKAL